jgi:hypothetical protein
MHASMAYLTSCVKSIEVALPGMYPMPARTRSVDDIFTIRGLLEPVPAKARSVGPIKCRERLGGALNFYYRAAA